MTAEENATAIKARGIRKEFGEDTILDSVDLDVKEGEIVVLMGPNGTGKTILMCCLSGGISLTEGEVSVFGEPLDDAADKLNVLLQGTSALPELTARQNIEFYSRLHPRSTDRWEDIVERLDIDDSLDGKQLRHFSGGMRRKIELAITLATDVPIYVLDEPAAELDLTTIHSLHDLFLSERDAGKTLLITSHTPLDAQIADRIVFLDDRGVTASGEPSSLLDDVPTVVRFRGSIREVRDVVTDFLIGGHLFERGDEARGFLDSETEIEDIVSAVETDDCTVETDAPSYTDMFNYYTVIEDSNK